jgi:hypothetical protein
VSSAAAFGILKVIQWSSSYYNRAVTPPPRKPGITKNSPLEKKQEKAKKTDSEL